MLDIFREKPIVINETLPAEVCLEMEPELPRDLKVQLWDVKKQKCYGTLSEVTRDGCAATFLLGKTYACLGAGRYLLRVWDGCHECDCLQLKLTRQCFVSGVSVTQAKGVCC